MFNLDFLIRIMQYKFGNFNIYYWLELFNFNFGICYWKYKEIDSI